MRLSSTFRTSRLLLAAAAVLVCSLPVTAQMRPSSTPRRSRPAPVAPQPRPATVATPAARPAVAARSPSTARLPAVAVAKADANGAFIAAYGSWDVGGGIAAMMATALSAEGFTVVERADLSHVLTEQELGANRLTTAESRPQLGRLVGARYLVFPSITEFSTADEGGGISLGFSFGNVPISGGISPQSSKGRIALDLRVVDSTTGQIATSFAVDEQIENNSLALNLSFRNVSVGGNNFSRTPLGEVARRLVDRAAAELASSLGAAEPWSGKVVASVNGEIVINGGSQAGVRAGDRFVVEREGVVFTDPDTGLALGGTTTHVGDLVVTRVEERLSYASFQPRGGGGYPERGDSVRSR